MLCVQTNKLLLSAKKWKKEGPGTPEKKGKKEKKGKGIVKKKRGKRGQKRPRAQCTIQST